MLRVFCFGRSEGYAIVQIEGKYYLAPVTHSRETLINSEFLQHMDVLPFSVAGKPQKMEKKIKSHFIFFVL